MKYEQWNLRRGGSDEARRQLELAGVPPLCAVVLCARGLDTPEKAREFLANGPELLHDPFLMRDMDRAARLHLPGRGTGGHHRRLRRL